jgi:RNA polymerase sigma factor (sigma-70 family)
VGGRYGSVFERDLGTRYQWRPTANEREPPLNSAESSADVEHAVLSHLDAAYNLTYWLIGDGVEAHDIVQEAVLGTLKQYDARGENRKIWLLKIVRRNCYRLIRARAKTEAIGPDAENRPDLGQGPALRATGRGLSALDLRLIEESGWQLIQALPVIYREALILREIERLSYEEIGLLAAIPVATVMSRLSQARAMLLQQVSRRRDASVRSAGDERLGSLAVRQT